MNKTALGAEALVPFDYVENVFDWIENNQTPLIGLEQTPSSISLLDFQPPEALTLILGEEVSGIPSDLIASCSQLIEIPMHGQKESFNVSVAAGIALYSLTNS